MPFVEPDLPHIKVFFRNGLVGTFAGRATPSGLPAPHPELGHAQAYRVALIVQPRDVAEWLPLFESGDIQRVDCSTGEASTTVHVKLTTAPSDAQHRATVVMTAFVRVG